MITLFYALMALQILLLFLVAKGFWPMVLDTDVNHRLRNLGIAIQVLAVTTGLRVFWWDVLPAFFTSEELQVFRDMTGNRLVPNVIFAVMTTLACLVLLKTIWLLIPRDERKYWTIFTAPFYPKLRGMLRSKLEE